MNQLKVFIVVLALTGANADFDNKDPSCICGIKNAGSRIVGGSKSNIGEYPWQAALVKVDSDGSAYFFCGGSLICDQYILTAAHCTDGMSASELLVILGDYNIYSATETESKTFKAAKIINHAGYDSDSMINDIALVKLSEKVNIPNEGLPICIPPPNPTYAGRDAEVTGWGTTSAGGDISNILLEVTVPVWNNTECESSYSDVRGISISSTMLCAGEIGKDSCQGDSGGPLGFLDAGDHIDQIGVVSFGAGCGGEYPGVYTRVNKYRAWIDGNTADCTYCAGFQ